MNKNNPDERPFELSIEEAKPLAQKFRATKEKPEIEKDPLPNIAPSLLSAEHIVDYVKETGLIAPFNADSSKSGRLKKASYEARLGDGAYYFEVPGGKDKSKGNDPKPLKRNALGNLVLPANSIIFLTCDLEFRLPPFIALRFNLSISHVHRGLLLGTGPLVDPGFWGKLCIPIHNLTDEPYEIAADDGLIWIEFTKTTSSPANGRLPSNDGKWDIKEFIVRAQIQIDATKDRVGIRSGISQALRDAETANGLIKDSSDLAKDAADRVRTISFVGVLAGGISLAAVVISVFALAAMYYFDTNAQYRELRPAIRTLESKFDEHIERLDLAGQNESEARASISKLSEMVAGYNQSVASLKSQLEAESVDRRKSEARVQMEKKESDRRINRLIKRISAFCSTQTDGENLDLCSNIMAEPID